MVSELAKLRPAPSILAWVAERRPGDLFLSAITLGDFVTGARTHPDPTRRDQLLA